MTALSIFYQIRIILYNCLFSMLYFNFVSLIEKNIQKYVGLVMYLSTDKFTHS